MIESDIKNQNSVENRGTTLSVELETDRITTSIRNAGICRNMVALRKEHGRTTYRDAGVDIDAGDDFVKEIAPLANSTIAASRPGPIDGLGGFGALFDIKRSGFIDPILVSSTDGVGTKLRIAIETGVLDTIGIDLVAMCVNDVLVHGAEPLFFLDYFAVSKLDRNIAQPIMRGIAKGCELAGAALVGGETAEMPGFYSEGDFDLAGFAVGAVERDRVLPRKSDIRPGNRLLGIASSGVHSNGFSLVRRLVANSGLRWSDPAPFEESISLGESLLTPTKIYVKSVLRALRNSHGIKALAHVTGSGALGKLHRALPPPSLDGVRAHIQLGSWKVPPVFGWLNEQAGFSKKSEDQRELLRAFNCGIGMVAVIDEQEVHHVRTLLEDVGEQTFEIGEIEKYSQTSDTWMQYEDAVRLTGTLDFIEWRSNSVHKTR